MAKAWTTGVLLLLAALAAPLAVLATDLVMLYSVQRHGARAYLAKTDLLAENVNLGGPMLLPEVGG